MWENRHTVHTEFGTIKVLGIHCDLTTGLHCTMGEEGTAILLFGDPPNC